MTNVQRTAQQVQPHQRLAHCNECHRETNHQCLFGESSNWHEELGPHASIYGCDTTLMLKCLGCGTIHMSVEEWFSEATDENGDPITTTLHYPATISRRRPEWVNSLAMWNSPGILGLLREIYKALDNDQPRLAAMGTRALVEHIMAEKVGDRGSFSSNVKAFVDQGYLASNDRADFEKALIETGHAAMHRSFLPNAEDLSVLMDMIENLIARLYVHPEAAKGVAGRIPPRRPKDSPQR